MCVCVCVCIYSIYIYIYIYIYICVCVCVCVCIDIYKAYIISIMIYKSHHAHLSLCDYAAAVQTPQRMPCIPTGTPAVVKSSADVCL